MFFCVILRFSLFPCVFLCFSLILPVFRCFLRFPLFPCVFPCFSWILPVYSCFSTFSPFFAVFFYVFSGFSLFFPVFFFSGAPRAKRACGAPWVNKSTHPRKLGNHVTDRPSDRATVRPHHRHTNVYSHTF